ncbi:MAG: tyrosine--tRNA ligase [Bavariicoccus seileri]|uniref:tyrosine--tRNA ligase n=1 Tax=Bavariicoccus seileri TaxID=549685 RepID=UPI003F9D9C59
MTSIIEDLKWRGAINQQTDEEGLKKLLEEKSVGVYCGVDPTGDSMHIGHLIPFMILRRFQLAGHKPFIIIGGATGSIGDPSGRKSERQLQTAETIQHNAESLTQQMRQLFLVSDHDKASVKLVNNYSWTSGISLLDFLRDYGKHFNVNQMLNKEVIASRLETGISYTEFTYQILQALDFLHLFQNEDVQLQIGGSDQWGNITAGVDFIRKIEGHEAKAFGLTIPLMLKSDGTKFGKSAGNAVWLDAKKTTPYEFYQFWINQDDRDVIKYLKYFTFLSHEEIEEYATLVETKPHERAAQKRLAAEVTQFVHGKKALEQAQNITKALFSGDVAALSGEEIRQGFKNMPHFTSDRTSHEIVPWLVDLGIESSRRQAREDITNGALSINGEKFTDVAGELSPEQAIDNTYIIIRRGKKKYFLVEFSD